MRVHKITTLLLLLALAVMLLPSCRNRSETFVIGLSDKLSTLDPVGSASVDAASERITVFSRLRCRRCGV